MIESISVGLATEADRHELSRFICGDESQPYIAELHAHIRGRALDAFLFPLDPEADMRLLVVRGDPGHRLVGIVAHLRNNFAADEDGELLDGSELQLLAIQLAVQGDRVDDRSLFRCVLEAAIEDIVQAERGSLMTCLVHPENLKMLEMCRSSGVFVEHEMKSGYSLFATDL